MLPSASKYDVETEGISENFNSLLISFRKIATLRLCALMQLEKSRTPTDFLLLIISNLSAAQVVKFPDPHNKTPD